MDLPSVRSYGEFSSNNYGVHCLEFSMSGIGAFYFSYQTLVAFRSPKTGLVIRQNLWATTTGKHLNWIDKDKSKRVSSEEFEKKYQETFGGTL